MDHATKGGSLAMKRNRAKERGKKGMGTLEYKRSRPRHRKKNLAVSKQGSKKAKEVESCLDI